MSTGVTLKIESDMIESEKKLLKYITAICQK